MQDLLHRLIVYLPMMVLALSAHEAAHAWAALWRGDGTARDQGRMTLLPFVHVDPFGSLVLPGFLLALQGTFLFGYAKPTPVDPGQLRSPKRDFSLVALAGPVANVALAAAFAGVGVLAFRFFGVDSPEARELVAAGILTNSMIAWVNLLPVPGLDGLKVLYVVIPDEWCWRLQRADRLMFALLILAAAGGILDWVLFPAFAFGTGLCSAAGAGQPFL